ncbi:radical SAM-linked protein [Longilinea arvoryzae]|uniref:Radical SAM-linked protein n=1 Tax=Longilinea arvoryzae TaxID=360412 RepID=A0A0S7BAD7_9CHLR|nr:TIGR03936 family radical SAM-associated protein [Longilinea arvoryzae]GAP14588.1 radical SAM-linked protein [Longilinea arvoryzae]
MIRIRISHTKTGALRYTGNLDMQKVWERTFRRAGLPLAYSQGFHPQPRINQACPLPLGFLSNVELLDVWLNDEMPLEEIRAAVQAAAPAGVSINDLEPIDLHAPRLQTLVDTADYVITLHQVADKAGLDQKIADLLAAPTLLRERRGKTYDLRPMIMAMRSEEGPAPFLQIHLRLTVREGATGRPEEVLLALGLDPFAASIERTQLNLKDPLAAAA